MLGAVVLAASFVAIVMPAGPAGAVTPTCTPPAGVIGGFEIDGNMTPGDCSANLDWGNAPGVGISTQGGTYSTSHKDDSNPNTWTSSGSTPPKGDFERAYSFAQTVGTDYFVYAAWERDHNTGTTGYIIEVDLAGVHNVGGVPQPDRSKGGFVFYITTQGAAAPVVGQACAFTSQPTYPGTCTNNTSGDYKTAINDAPITDPLNGGTVDASDFMEIGLNVTALTGVKPGCPAPAAASLYLRSYTGSFQTFPSLNLKGYLLGVPIAPPSTCSTITIHKVTENGDATFDYSTTGGLSPGTFQLSNGGTRTYDEVPPGTYTVTEGGLPAGWAFVSLTCTTTGADSYTIADRTVTITAANAGTTDCIYTNRTKVPPTTPTSPPPSPPTSPPTPPPPPPPPSPPTPLANTGFPTGAYLGSAVGLLLAGALILGFSVRRRRGRHEA